MKFIPKIRFVVMSDVHYKDKHTVERDRFKLAMKAAYEYSEKSPLYKSLDALFVVGDFSDSGSETQMQAFKKSLDENVKKGTDITLSAASHEFSKSNGGEEAAIEKINRIYAMKPDVAKVINGFHFISLSTTNGCRFDDAKRSFAADSLKEAAADDPKKPIFFFQHPHISGTVYGSINWGEDELTDILMNYPQIIDFSGHSHAPINDPRSIHQKYFTSLGTGTLSYFELDEFDKVYGTLPPRKENAAQMLIVEADENNRVRVYPYDLISKNFFPFVWKIDEPSDPSTFIYTDERYNTTIKPYFKKDVAINFSDISSDRCTITFEQAAIKTEYVNDYYIVVKKLQTGTISKQISIWSEYYFYDMPKTISQVIDGLEANTRYDIEIHANGFWKNRSDQPLKSSFSTKA